MATKQVTIVPRKGTEATISSATAIKGEIALTSDTHKWYVGNDSGEFEEISNGGTLYNSLGQNTDGAITQKATTDALKDPTCTSSDINVMINSALTIQTASNKTIRIGTSGSLAVGNQSVVIGGSPNSTGNSNLLSIGIGSKANSQGTAVGINAQATGSSGVVAVGAASATGQCSTSIGDSSKATTGFTTACGYSSDCSGQYSVALGGYSKVLSTELGVVSIGDGGANPYYGTRKIINVKDPTQDQDAATKKYVDDAIGTIPSGTLYNTTGQNTDGAMTQKATTDMVKDPNFSDNVRIGKNVSSATDTVVIGDNTIGLASSTVLGSGSKGGRRTVCVGSNINTPDIESSVLIGSNSYTDATRTVAIGGLPYLSDTNTRALGEGTISIGSGAGNISDSGTRFNVNLGCSARCYGANTDSSVALGYSANVQSKYATGLGSLTNIADSCDYSVVIGSRSLANEASVVSFGSGTSNANYGTRRLINVKDPVNKQDAATKVYVDNAVSGLITEINAKDVVFNEPKGTSKLSSTNVQEAIDELDEDMRYNSIYVFDATVQSAPPNMPRGYNWHVDMIGDFLTTHQYSRYFYSSLEDSLLDQPGSPNINSAVAHWVIDGKHMYFEYLENGSVNTVVELTDSSGNILLDTYRPIPMGDTWFFGKNQADPFPTDDNSRSIIDINVQGLYFMLGNTFNLTTTNKQIVGAINEIDSQVGSVVAHEEQTVQEALAYSQANPTVLTFVAK